MQGLIRRLHRHVKVAKQHGGDDQIQQVGGGSTEAGVRAEAVRAIRVRLQVLLARGSVTGHVEAFRIGKELGQMMGHRVGDDAVLVLRNLVALELEGGGGGADHGGRRRIHAQCLHGRPPRPDHAPHRVAVREAGFECQVRLRDHRPLQVGVVQDVEQQQGGGAGRGIHSRDERADERGRGVPFAHQAGVLGVELANQGHEVALARGLFAHLILVPDAARHFQHRAPGRDVARQVLQETGPHLADVDLHQRAKEVDQVIHDLIRLLVGGHESQQRRNQALHVREGGNGSSLRPGPHHGELARDQLLHLRIQGAAGVAVLEPRAHDAVIGPVPLDERRIVPSEHLVDVPHRVSGRKQLVAALLHQRVRFGAGQHQRALSQDRYPEHRSEPQILLGEEFVLRAVSIGTRLPTSGSPGASGMLAVVTGVIDTEDTGRAEAAATRRPTSLDWSCSRQLQSVMRDEAVLTILSVSSRGDAYKE